MHLTIPMQDGHPFLRCVHIPRALIIPGRDCRNRDGTPKQSKSHVYIQSSGKRGIGCTVGVQDSKGVVLLESSCRERERQYGHMPERGPNVSSNGKFLDRRSRDDSKWLDLFSRVDEKSLGKAVAYQD